MGAEVHQEVRWDLAGPGAKGLGNSFPLPSHPVIETIKSSTKGDTEPAPTKALSPRHHVIKRWFGGQTYIISLTLTTNSVR